MNNTSNKATNPLAELDPCDLETGEEVLPPPCMKEAGQARSQETRTRGRWAAVVELGYGAALILIGLINWRADFRFGWLMVAAGIVAILIGCRVWTQHHARDPGA